MQAEGRRPPDASGGRGSRAMPTFQLELERWHWNVGYSISGTFSEERSKDNAKEGLYDSDEIRTRAGNPSRNEDLNVTP